MALIFALSGCAGSGAGPLGLGAVIGDRNLASAEPLFSEREEKCFDSGDQFLTAIFGPVDEDQMAKPVQAGGRHSDCGAIAASFQHVIGSSSEGGLSSSRYTTQQRNEIIDILMATSNRKCTRYVAMLKNADAAVNSSLSISAIITSGLGSFVGGVNTAKALSGSAAILSGSREAINQTYLSNLTIHVLAAAMEKARDRLRRDITNREACSTSSYTLSRGLEDIFQYHGACSISVGLAEAAIAVERSQNPGLDAMRNSLAQYAALVRQAEEVGKAGTPTPVAGPMATPDLSSVTATNAKLASAQANVATLTQELDAFAKKAKQDAEAAKASPADAALAATAAASAKARDGKQEELNGAGFQRDALVQQYAGELQRLASSVTFATPAIVAPETRACPFGMGQ
ncbi:hypothetical protein [Sphingobium amiense]|uniref:hypothetical protein n=1 Tax=Sphingobium amiense TaxID=135719 RepID=UPI000A58F360|nr:hypothetical protein [Sphingobium amiense]